MNSILLIPIYEPSDKTVLFMNQLIATLPVPIVIVDDGSGSEYQDMFQQFVQKQHVHFLSYPINQGKGFALRYGMRYIEKHFPETNGFVTADSDGQHTIVDISRALEKAQFIQSNQIILGVRSFNKEATPTKSYYGNRLTSQLFRLATQLKLEDTQTGLRVFSTTQIPNLVTIKGNRFEYEMNVLLALKEFEWDLDTFKIETIYENNNEQTHFRPIKDSLLVYFPFLRFLLSSLASSFVDIGFFMLLSLVLGKAGEMIFLATLLARVTAGICNYYLNKQFVFSDKAPVQKSSWKYLVLFIAQLVISGVSVSALSTIFSSLLIIKLFVDLSLFFFSFQIQKYFIFNHTT